MQGTIDRRKLFLGASATLGGAAFISGNSANAQTTPTDTLTTVNSVAELKAIPTALLDDQSSVLVLGYYQASDGGGGIYTFDASSTESDNEGSVIEADDNPASGRWLLNHTGAVSFKQFGMISTNVAVWSPDYFTSAYPTQATHNIRVENTRRLQSALDWVKFRGGTLIGNTGVYLCDPIKYTPHTQHIPLTIIGEGTSRGQEPENTLHKYVNRTCILYFDNIQDNEIAFELGAISQDLSPQGNEQGIYSQGIRIENIYILGKHSSNATGLDVKYCPDIILRDVHVSSFGVATKFYQSWAALLDNVSAARSTVGTKFETGSNAMSVNSFRASYCDFGIEINDGAGINFDAVWLEFCTSGCIINNSVQVNGTTFVSPHCESIDKYSFELGFDRNGNPTAGEIRSVTIVGGYFDSVGTDIGLKKMRVSESFGRDLNIIGEMGNFSHEHIDGNFEAVNLVRSSAVKSISQTGPYTNNYTGSKTAIVNGESTEFLTINVPVGDYQGTARLRVTAMDQAARSTITNEYIISLGRKEHNTAYANIQSTMANACIATDGAGIEMESLDIELAVEENRVVLSANIAINYAPYKSSMQYHIETLSGERNSSIDRQITFLPH